MSLVLDEAPAAPVALDWPRRRTAALASTPLSDAELRELAHRFEHAPADEIVGWAAARFGHRLTLAASMADAVLIDVASRVMPGIEVIFLDTQYHFQETLATAERIRDRYPIRLRVVWPEARPDDRWRTDPDACCHARKVAPMERALEGRAAWLSGLRRADSAHRNEVSAVHRDSRGLVKINPLIGWSDDDVTRYIAEHDVPVNPLVAQGYASIGCWPCTRPVRTGEDARAGRWDGSGKTECGLHL